MEKKIERVPYISKWYKEEKKDELLHFAFDEQNVGSDWDVDKFSLYDKNIYTYSTNTTNGLWATEYSKPRIQLKYDLTCAIQKYIENIDDIINKKQRQQLERLEKQSKPKKSYEENVYKLTKQDVDCISNKIKSMLDILSDITIPTDKYKEILKLMFDIPNMVYKKSCEKCED